MIIESAFLKLPELLTSGFSHSDTFEATVVHLLSIAVFMELNARNVARPFDLVRTEKPYPVTSKDGRPIQADLHIDLESVIPTARLVSYGTREQNWVEAKAFLSSVRHGTMPPSTANAGKILRDLLRLCLLPEELTGPIRQNGRYFLAIFSNPPSGSVALQTRDGDREWLSRLLTEGYSDLRFDLQDEPKTLREAVGPGFINSSELKAALRIRTMMFQPERDKPSPVFWGYLARIRYFHITVPNAEVEYEDEPGDKWDESRAKQLETVRDFVVTRF